MKNSFERPVTQEEGDRLFKEMREQLADPDFIPEKQKIIETRAATEKSHSEIVKKAKSSQISTSSVKESDISKGWLNDWQERQEAEAERRMGIGFDSIDESKKEQERLAEERRMRDSGLDSKQSNN